MLTNFICSFQSRRYEVNAVLQKGIHNTAYTSIYIRTDCIVLPRGKVGLP